MSKQTDNTEQQLQDYLAGKSALSTAYAESPKLKAPDALSTHIKDMARQAIKHEKRTRAWYIPLTLAAAIALSVTIYLFSSQQYKSGPAPALVQQNRHAPPAEQPKLAGADEKPAMTSPTDAPIPAHIRDLLQATGKRADKQDPEGYPDKAELKKWSPQQWASRIHQLQLAGKKQLADRYIRDFSNYYPKRDIQTLLKQQAD